jgi:hypothetical protein
MPQGRKEPKKDPNRGTRTNQPRRKYEGRNYEGTSQDDANKPVWPTRAVGVL